MRLLMLAVPSMGLVNLMADQLPSGGDTATIGTLIVQLGLSGVFLWQWQAERKRNDALTEKFVDLIERFGATLTFSNETLRDVQQGLSNTVEKVKGTPDRDSWDRVVRRLESTTDSLRDELRDVRETTRRRGRQADE